jgi:hypothetical protein
MSTASTTSDDTPWIKAQASNGSNGCVRMRRLGDKVQLSDSKDPDGPVLTFTGHEVAAFLDGVSKDEFKHLYADLI